MFPHTLARLFIGLGIVLVLVGVGLMILPRVPWLGRLPGDLHFRRDGFEIFIPLGTSVLLSIVATVVLNLLLRGR